MSALSDGIHEQIGAAYKRMAERGYRPEAPGDILRQITVPTEELDLDQEASDYAVRWWAEEDGNGGEFFVGYTNFETRPATIYAIEAVRLLAEGDLHQNMAALLLTMALDNVLEAERGG
jgi:hypothetical protein